MSIHMVIQLIRMRTAMKKATSTSMSTIMTTAADATAIPHDHCGHDHGEQPKDEDTAVLKYMLEHNKHHAQELAAIAKHLREQGKEEAAAQIEKGVEDFEKGNMRLSIALSLVQ